MPRVVPRAGGHHVSDTSLRHSGDAGGWFSFEPPSSRLAVPVAQRWVLRSSRGRPSNPRRRIDREPQPVRVRSPGLQQRHGRWRVARLARRVLRGRRRARLLPSHRAECLQRLCECRWDRGHPGFPSSRGATHCESARAALWSAGGGLGLFNWRYSEVGEFIDFTDFAVFQGRFVADGTDVGAIALGGVRVPMGRFAIGGELRYQRVSGRVGIDQGFLEERIDIGGLASQFTFQIKF